MNKLLSEKIDQVAASHREKENALDLIKLRFNRAEQALSVLTVFLGERLKLFIIPSHFTTSPMQVIVQVDVDSMREIEPVLASLEIAFSTTFDKSHDRAEVRWRQFESTKTPWIRVDAAIRSDAAGCRSEVVGYEQTPMYEIKCD